MAIETLFGITPDEIEAQRAAQSRQQAMQFAQMSPAERATMGFYQAGNQLGGALASMMGAKDPELERAATVNKLVQETDMNDLESVKGLVGQLNKAGAVRQAMALLPRIDALTKTQEDRQFRKEDKEATLEARKEEIKVRGEQRLAEIQAQAAAALERAREANASREQMAQIAAEARKEAARAAAETRLLVAQLTQANKPKSAAELRAEEKALAKEEGKQGLSDTVSRLSTIVEELSKAGGMTSTGKNAVANLMTSAGTSAVGQAAGRMVGTANQAKRDELQSLKMQLLNDIKNATGMSAQQLNSNVELKTMLDSLGSPGMTKEANTAILTNIQNKYGVGGVPVAPSSNPTSAETPKTATLKFNPATGKLEKVQ